MGIPPHLDRHYAYNQKQLTAVAEVVAVINKDNTKNYTEAFTLYDLIVYTQWPDNESQYPMVAPLGQHGTGESLTEDPYREGDLVLVGFCEGDELRCYIIDRYPDVDTEYANTADEHPRCRWKRNGVELEIDKNGRLAIKQKAGQAIEIQDSNGKVRTRYTEAGNTEVFDSNGDVQAIYAANGECLFGGASGHKRLLTEDFVGNLSSAITAIPPTSDANTFKAGLLAILNAAFTTANSTSKLKGK